MILDGSLESGSKISEVIVSKIFSVSRTPVRLALRVLEVEGLIQKRHGRGYTVLAFNFDDLTKAYEVRGVLEGLAASNLAREGLHSDAKAELKHIVARIEGFLRSDMPFDKIAVGYEEGNVNFHELIMSECNNEFIRFAFARISNFPLIGLGTIVFNKHKVAEEMMRLRFGNMQHSIILDAIDRRDAFRAESLMREHANQIPLYTSLLVEKVPERM